MRWRVRVAVEGAETEAKRDADAMVETGLVGDAVRDETMEGCTEELESGSGSELGGQKISDCSAKLQNV